MNLNQKKILVVVLGATATGKTAVSVELARKFSTEILSCDSRQFYHEIPIGTAAPTAEELALAPHHFIATRSLTDDYSCGKYEHDAIALLDKLFEKHSVVIMTGGSGLYIDAVCNGMDQMPSDVAIRESLAARLETSGLESLVDELKGLDPQYCQTADLANKQRVLRALEVSMASGKPYSS
ncbi:MAG: isopentenyl transferase family protein, partial [Rikenellaceae bacterium]